MNTAALPVKKKSLYPTFYFRAGVYLLIAHFLVAYGEEQNIFELLQLSYYYTALSGSIAITVLLGEFIYFTHHHFERYFTWQAHAGTRFLLQIGVGIFLSSGAAVLMAMVYFKLNHISIFETGYFKHDFTVVSCFITMLNAFYVIVSLYEYKILTPRKNLPNDRRPVQQQVEQESPMLIFSENKHCYYFKADGEKIHITKTLKEMRMKLASEDYFSINRSEIIHRSIIDYYMPAESNTLKLVMKVPFDAQNYYVSQRNAVAFKRWFEG